ncbi:MAG: DUF1129 domain-containing protein [Ruminococcaceae bacterium]|nr:DUF1129 domain-containing protein [Oscillospiraceae bacterium]
MAELKGEYIYDFYDVKEYIESHAKACEKRNEAIETLHSIYLEAQEKGTPLSEIHEGSPKEYAKEIVEGLPHISPEKKKIIKRVLITVFAFVIAVLAYFTSDYYYMQKYGYNYYMKFPEIFSGAPFGRGDENYTAYLTVGDDGYPTQDANLSAAGMYFDGIMASNNSDDYFTVIMRSETKQVSPLHYTFKYPGFTYGGGEYQWMHTKSGRISAEVGGLPFSGEVVRVNATGKDLCYWIDFTASDENADYSGIAKRINSGEIVTVYLNDINNMSWQYRGILYVILEKHFPFFVSYNYDPIIEGKQTSGKEEVYYYLTTSDGKATAVVRTEYNEELGGQELIWDSVPRKLDESLDWVESGMPFLDDEGLICVEITETFKDGTTKTETIKAEKKTKLVYSEFVEYIADKALEVRIHAERDEEGRFVELRGHGFGIGLPGYVYDENGDPIYQFADFNPEVYILENGDVAMEIKYYKTDEPEKIIEETIIFDHKKY